MNAKVGGFEIRFLVDSGSPINTVTEDEWLHMRAARSKTFDVRDKCERQFKGYAAGSPLEIVAVFKAEMKPENFKPSVIAEFFVVRGASQALLGRFTARAARLLVTGMDVLAIEDIKPFPKFPGVLVDLHINKDVQPVQVTYYRVPVAVEPRLKEIWGSLKAQEIVEDVTGPAPWISPVVIAQNGEKIRPCVNMQEPNKAIMREHHPMPTSETFISKLKGAVMFSKVDLSRAFHHVPLTERSRVLTTFMTGEGLMRFTRLTFGMNAAPEIFQRIMEKMLDGLEGVIVFIDDIVAFGRSKEEHESDWRRS